MRAPFSALRLLGVDSGGPRWPLLVLSAGDLVLRPPEMDDFLAWARVREESRAFLMRWEPPWPEDDLTRSAFRKRIRRYHLEIERDETYPFFIIRAADDQIMGGVTLGNIRRGAAQTGTIGYWMGHAYAGHGHMSRAVRRVCRHAFDNLGLARIEASCLPENAISMHLLEKAGFRREGVALQYLNIAGTRRDHILFALLPGDLACD